jgi:hypothetical protein
MQRMQSMIFNKNNIWKEKYYVIHVYGVEFNSSCSNIQVDRIIVFV